VAPSSSSRRNAPHNARNEPLKSGVRSMYRLGAETQLAKRGLAHEVLHGAAWFARETDSVPLESGSRASLRMSQFKRKNPDTFLGVLFMVS